MAELGAGGGSGYPAVIDSDVTVEANTDYARKAVPNDLAAAIVAIETELGIAPSGGYATVVARLNTLSNTAGGVPRGLFADRPLASEGTLYHSTDENLFEWSDGTNWHAFLTGG